MALGDVLTEINFSGDDGQDIEFSPDGNYVAVGNDAEEVIVFEYDTGNIVTTFTGHSSNVNCVAWSQNGNYVASGSDGNNVRVWEYETGTEITLFSEHQNWVYGIDWSPDGNYIVSSDIDGAAKVWEYDTKTVITNFTGHSQYCVDVEFSPNGNLIASAGSYNDETMKIFEYDTGNIIVNYTNNDRVNCVAWSPNGNYVAFGDNGNNSKVYDLSQDSVITTYTLHNANVNSVDFTGINNYIVSADANGIIQIWEYETGTKNFEITHILNEINAIHLKGDNTHLAAAIGGGGDKAEIIELIETTGFIYFKTSDGKIINTAGAGLDLRLDVDNIVLGSSTNIIPITFVNETGLTLTNIDITASNEATGVDLLMSKTEDPFDGLQSLNYSSDYADDAEETFYLKVDIDSSAGTGAGSVTLNISAEESA